MKIIKYNLLSDGTIPTQVIDGGYFAKYNGKKSPQDYDLIGLSDTWVGLGEIETDVEFETYIKSFRGDHTDTQLGISYKIDIEIDTLLSKK